MLRALKNARFGQIVLVIAGLLAITGSVGLHPEPSGAFPAAVPDGLARADSPRAQDGASHGCLACLAHRSLSLLGPAAVALEPGAFFAFAAPAGSDQPLAPTLRTHAGRAPPALA